MTISRRAFMAAGAATFGLAALPVTGWSQAAPMRLTAASRVLDINGRAATVFGLQGPSGQGLVLDAGQRFRVELENTLTEPTLVHWHGQIPPNDQDGVPDIPMPLLQPGEARSYDFATMPGTYWMHSHVPMQEINMLAAPLIIRSTEDMRSDRQDATMFLNDFSFKAPQEVMAEILEGHGSGSSEHGTGHMADGDMQMDLNDFDWDAYLTNDRTLDDPDVIRVEKGGKIRLRVINAASATVFWIDGGGLPMRLVAVDGHDIQSVENGRFGIAMGQRLDIELDLPSQEGSWPILALREGAKERSGLILATANGKIPKIAPVSDHEAPPFDIDLSQEAGLRALNSLPTREDGRRIRVMLGGTMQPYVWTINDAVWGEHVPVQAKHGERILLEFHNMSMMGHPMHLHGHVFQVVDIMGRSIAPQSFAGALRDTVYIPPMARVTIALDAGEAARWMLHCHHMPHLETGMMTEFQVLA